MTLGNTEDKDKILNAFSEDKHIPYKSLGISTALEFSTAALAAERKNKKNPIMTSNTLKEKYFQPRILYPAKLSE